MKKNLLIAGIALFVSILSCMIFGVFHIEELCLLIVLIFMIIGIGSTLFRQEKKLKELKDESIK